MGCTGSKDSKETAKDVEEQFKFSKVEGDESEAREKLIAEWRSELKSAVLPVHPLSEEAIAKHNKGNDLWIIVAGEALDCTEWQFSHPAGPAPIMRYAGKDCTEDFNRIHSRSAKDMVKKFSVGKVVTLDGDDTPASTEPAKPKEPSHKSFTVLESESLTHNTKRIKFAAPSFLKMAPGGHMSVVVPEQGVARSYTPYLIDGTSFTMMVKKYDGGVASGFLHSLNAGAAVEMDGPIDPYVNFPKTGIEDLFLVAGGTGIAPMYSMALAAVSDKRAATITIIGCYKNRDELLLHQQTAKLKATANIPVKYYLVYSREEGDVSTDGADATFTGRLNASQLEKMTVVAGAKSLVYVCGPPAFNGAAEKVFKSLNVSQVNLM